jgi:DNA helicase-2/ATP-dependent DNA helicase PcrA
VTSKVLHGLNAQQAAAVQDRHKELLILAGAGSGKTRTLTHRIAWFLEQRIAKDFEILAICFTNKAANELKSRIIRLVGPQAKAMQVSTFHSACLRLLRREAQSLNFKPNFTIYDEADKRQLLNTILNEFSIDPKKFPAANFAHRISLLKNHLISPGDYIENELGNHKSPLDKYIYKVYPTYQTRLMTNQAMDFDDILVFTVQLLTEFGEARQHYYNWFKHIFVDEYQDTNSPQYKIVRMLHTNSLAHTLSKTTGLFELPDAAEAPKSGTKPFSIHTLTVVGDSDQSIYKFRGSTVRNIMDFEKDFPNAHTVVLNQNYRSTQQILDVANIVIKENFSIHKKILSSNLPPGQLVELNYFPSDRDESAYIADQLSELTSLKDSAVLYRNNSLSRSIEEALTQRRLDYRIVGGVKFYERREIKDLIAYLKLLINPDDDVAFTRVINVPRRGIGKTTIDRIANHARDRRLSMFQALQETQILGVIGNAEPRIRKFLQMISELSDLANNKSVPEVIEALLQQTGYLIPFRNSLAPEDLSRIDNVQELTNIAADWTKENPTGGLADFLERISLYTDLDQIDTDSEDADYVTLMTLHSAKGLEFENIFILGIEEGILPAFQSQDSIEDIEEERRLFYVGLTRAKRRLSLNLAQTRYRFGRVTYAQPSRFLRAIDPSLLVKNNYIEAYTDVQI